MTDPTPSKDQPWLMRTYSGYASAAESNRLYRDNIAEAEILATLDELFARYATEREAQERFGDFVERAGIVRRVVNAARDFHD